MLLEAIARLDHATLRVAGAGPEDAGPPRAGGRAPHRRPRRAGRLGRPGPAARLLPRPGRARGAVLADARVVGAVRPRRRRGDGVRRPGRRQRHGRPPRRGRRRRPPRPARRPGGPRHRPQVACSRTTRCAASWSRRGVERAQQASWSEVAGDYLGLYERAIGTTADPQRGLEIVVVAYGRPDLLEDSLQPVLSFPVTVVDNSSSPDVAAVCERLGVRYLDPGRNGGFAAGVNHALDRRLRPGRRRAPAQPGRGDRQGRRPAPARGVARRSRPSPRSRPPRSTRPGIPAACRGPSPLPGAPG